MVRAAFLRDLCKVYHSMLRSSQHAQYVYVAKTIYPGTVLNDLARTNGNLGTDAFVEDEE